MRVAENYASVQGEGPRVGETTVFLRFGGCNLRCPGWPCDTQHAIDPKFRKEWKELDAFEIFEEVDKKARTAGAQMVTWTGGEPFLQRNEDLRTLEFLLRDAGYFVECFSNGTILYPDWAVDGAVKFIMDWKLPGSGEDPYNANRLQNLKRMRSTDAIKFVIKDMHDFDIARVLWRKYIQGKSPAQVYYGRVWDAALTDAKLTKWVMLNQLPWKLNVQLHNYIWDPQERGR